MSVRELLRARPDSDDPLARHAPDSHPGVKDKKKAAAAEAVDDERLAGLQERLFAEDRRSLLLVLQGIDTSGKDGTIKHVIGEMDPVGVRITSFKKPTPEELEHDFLWRIRKGL
ncbi:MAG TPA: polyphosphate kinase 2 family protein, partial [Acidimicrobiia bacterium]|nr:polyphosphate kinase 2 family protein [Acidimicrobiia bacterium]